MWILGIKVKSAYFKILYRFPRKIGKGEETPLAMEIDDVA